MLQTVRRGALAAGILVLLAPAAAPARDFAETALNIIPSGQYGGLPGPAGGPEYEQANLYDALTPLAANVTADDLTKYFKSARLGGADAGPLREEKVPRRGVTLMRDRFNVPHITGATRDDVTWATGWVLQQDRGLLLAQGRYPARIAALDVPGVFAFALVVGLKTFTPTKRAERIIDRAQTRALRRTATGRSVLHDIDVYIDGINDRLRFEKSAQKPWTRVDVYAINALAGQIFGRGGGGETQTAMLLDGLRDRLGARGATVWNDLTLNQDPEHPSTIDRAFPYAPIPRRTTGNVVIDDGSFKASPVPKGAARAASAPAPGGGEPHASNFLMVAANRSTNGHPLFVAGPQIGYFYPGLTMEIDVKGPGFEARGATAPGFAGNVLIGRGPDFAWSLTSAGSDVIDTYAETLCGGSSTRYRYRGRCRAMGRVTAGVVKDAGTLRYRTTVHGPVIGYATSNGRRVALSAKRSSYGRDIEWQFPFRDLTLNRVTSARSFFTAMARSPFTFNAAYALSLIHI